MNTSSRNHQLDILRGIAVLLVILHHFELVKPESAVTTIVKFFAVRGGFGVDLFFVLSGFLISGLLFCEYNRSGGIDVKRFLIRRGFKIYPPYYLFLLYLLLRPAFNELGRADGDIISALSGAWLLYWPNYIFIQNYVATPIGHLWTIAIEEHFYLMLPFLLVFLLPKVKVKVIVAAFLSVLLVNLVLRYGYLKANSHFTGNIGQTHLRIDSLFLGVAVRLAFEGAPLIVERLKGRGMLTVVAGLGIFLLATTYIPISGTYTYALKAIAAALILVGSLGVRLSGASRLFGLLGASSVVLRFVGRYSYVTYLWHVTVMRIVERQIDTYFYSEDMPHASLWWLVSLLVVFAASCCAGWAISEVLEGPVLRLRDRMFPSRSNPIPS